MLMHNLGLFQSCDSRALGRIDLMTINAPPTDNYFTTVFVDMQTL